MCVMIAVKRQVCCVVMRCNSRRGTFEAN